MIPILTPKIDWTLLEDAIREQKIKAEAPIVNLFNQQQESAAEFLQKHPDAVLGPIEVSYEDSDFIKNSIKVTVSQKVYPKRPSW